ncbi:MAG TPA: SDR family NAD(P)-dependent oxidoreductase, partial [Ktedonobacteraceae bacterium]|nr:SDR family NAD(P)-dependent oxidoreductase [Ktedonobacteraceae bacterium]
MKSRTVVITGSTKGIGRGIALRLARDHHNIVLNYANDDKKAQETLHLCEQITAQVLLVKADVSKKSEVEYLMQQSIQRFGMLDVLVNNAACVVDKPALEMSEEEWEQVINVNLKGTFLCSQMAATYMLQQEDGGIILNIGASTGIRARKNGINTCASKAGIMIITQCLALELGPKVRANTIIPGLTRTEETEHRFNLNDPSVLRSREETIPLQR